MKTKEKVKQRHGKAAQTRDSCWLNLEDSLQSV
jgi:hypothetical protein